MQTLETIAVKLKRLPAEQQLEVMEFVDSLLSRLPENSDKPEESDFDQVLDETFGIWPDEVDGVEYENRLRKQWGNRVDELSR